MDGDLSQEGRLIVGLGNPDADYADTRHNLGFACVRELARRMAVKRSRFMVSRSLPGVPAASASMRPGSPGG